MRIQPATGAGAESVPEGQDTPSPTHFVPTPSPTQMGSRPTKSPTPLTSRTQKVLVVIEENHSYAQMKQGMSFLAGLSLKYGYATHWSALAHPSLPNYIDLAAGTTFGILDDKSPAAHTSDIGPATSVFDQAITAGKTAGTYPETMSENCHVGAGDRAATNSANAETSPCPMNRPGCSFGYATILYLIDASNTHKGWIAAASSAPPMSARRRTTARRGASGHQQIACGPCGSTGCLP